MAEAMHSNPAMNKSTVLLISHLRLHPVGWGCEARVRQLIAWLLGAGYRVVYLHYGTGPMSATEVSRLPQDLVYVEAGSRARELVSRVKETLRNRARTLFTMFSDRVATKPDGFVWSAALGPLVTRVAAQYRPDAVILEYIWATPAAAYLPTHTLKIIDTHDVFSDKKRLYDAGIDPFFYCSESVERACLMRAEVIMAIQAQEARWFRQLVPERKVIVVPHAADIVDSPSIGVDPVILFVGSAYPANLNGITRFAQDCWPRVLARRPEARLRIVGDVVDKIDIAIPSCDRVGRVPDLSPEYERAMIVINPVPLGTGLKIKSVEALCRGKVLVSTTSGVTGIPEHDTGAFVVADDWIAMAGKICNLLGDPAARRRIAAAGLALANRHFGMEVAFRELKAVLEAGKSNQDISSGDR